MPTSTPASAMAEAIGAVGRVPPARTDAAASGLAGVWAPVRDFGRRHRLGAVGAAFVALTVAVAALAPVMAPYDPNAQNLGNVLLPPSASHWLGTDDLGRDVLSRLIHGARVSLQAGILTVAFAMVAGVALGLVGGYAGGRVDEMLMRVMDAILAFPSLVL